MMFILLLAFGLGVRGLNADIIWSDELFSLAFMGAFDPPYSPAQIIATLQVHAPDHVPLYYFFGSIWGQITDWHQLAMRFISLVAGVLMVAWLYRFASDVVNLRAGVIAAMLMTTSAFVVVYFHELRVYTFLMMLSIMHSWAYWRLAYGDSQTRRIWLLFVLTTAALLYTHNFSLILFSALGTSHLIYATRSRRWRQIIVGWGAGALLFVPYVAALLGGSFTFGSSARAASTVDVAQVLARLLVNGYELFWLPIILCFGYALWRHRNRSINHLVIMTLIMLAVLLVANMRFNLIPLSRMRYFLVSWWLLPILFAYGLVSVPRWKAVTALFVLLWSGAGYIYGSSDRILDYTGFISFARTYPPLHNYVDNLRGNTLRTDYLLGFTEEPWANTDRDLHGGWGTIDYYLKMQLEIDGIFIDVNGRAWEIERDVQQVLDERPSVLFAHNPQQFQQQVETALDVIRQDYLPCDILAVKPDLVIRRYVFRILGCDHVPAPVNYDNGIKLVDRGALLDVSSEIVQVLTWWELPEESMLDRYNISLQFVTPNGQKQGIQVDRHLSDNLLPWNVLELPTTDLPVGEYRLMLILYHRDSGEKVVGKDFQSGATEKFIEVLAIEVQ